MTEPRSESSSPRFGVAIVRALITAGVCDFVLAPGSRSAPLALALAAAERMGLARLHVRVDERSAGYLALGIAKGGVAGPAARKFRPVAVVTTSGTAAVNLHPAIVEASFGGVPLIALTADRPPRLRRVGAHQTIDQPHIFGDAVRFECDLHVGDESAQPIEAALAVQMATDAGNPGPVHINIAFDEPLVDPTFDCAAMLGEISDRTLAAGDHRQSVVVGSYPNAKEVWKSAAQHSHGIIIVGDTAGLPESAADPQRIAYLADATGWPIIVEPSASMAPRPEVLAHGALLLGDAGFMAEHFPDVVVTVGRVGLHRGVLRLMAQVSTHLSVDPRPVGLRCNPLGTAKPGVESLPEDEIRGCPEGAWTRAWVEADHDLARVIGASLESAQLLSGPVVARVVVQSLTESDLFVVGPSWPMRHVSEWASRTQARCIANRGTSGIDGVVSTAWGAALAHDAYTVALIGDLTSVYDRNGLLSAPGEPLPHLTYVVADNDGGGIFSSLEQADDAFCADFERVFGTPRGRELSTLLAGSGAEVVSVNTTAQLHDALENARRSCSVSIIIASCVSRDEEARIVQRLRSVAASELAPGG